MNGQITLFDLLPKNQKPLPLGYVRDGETLKGEMIPFHDLKNYIGKQVLLEMPRQSAVDYKVILITDYYPESDNIYDWENGEAVFVRKCDRVGYSDNNRRRKVNSWVSEMFCKNGLGTDYKYPECMYEIRRQDDADRRHHNMP